MIQKSEWATSATRRSQGISESGCVIVHAIASRGRPEMLLRVVELMLERAALKSTSVVVGLDADDPKLDEYMSITWPRQVGFLVNPRQYSIGQVYNIIANEIPADLYINGADDIAIDERGWDARLVKAYREHFPDGVGVLGFGKGLVHSAIPVYLACSRKMIDGMGYWLQSHTSFWWHDAWLWEIACFADKLRMVDVSVYHVPENAFQTQGRRDVLWWADFFDKTRPIRRATAERISGPDHDWRAVLNEIFYETGCWLRNPAYVAHHFPDPQTPPDDRYRQIKAAAEKYLAGVANG